MLKRIVDLEVKIAADGQCVQELLFNIDRSTCTILWFEPKAPTYRNPLQGLF